MQSDGRSLIERAVVGLTIGVIGLYRMMISPVLPRCCGFVPSCSAYAEQAFRKHGLLVGLKLSMLRILRCHPLGGSGCDPVP
jgi:putative membrane protein insertion efficiency factor